MSDCLKRIQTLARNHCAAFTGTDGCRFEPNGQSRCQWFRTDAQALPFIEAGDMRCLEFERSVLPIDPALEDAYFSSDAEPGAKCQECRLPFSRKSNRQRFCPTCAKSRRRQADRLRKQRKAAQ